MVVKVAVERDVISVGRDEILQLTGYGPNACLLDIVEIEFSDRKIIATGRYEVKAGKNPLIDDHFPGDIILPKNLAGEMIEQVGYVLLAKMGIVKPKKIRARETPGLKMCHEVHNGDIVVICLSVPIDFQPTRRVPAKKGTIDIYPEVFGEMYRADDLCDNSEPKPVAKGSFVGLVIND